MSVKVKTGARLCDHAILQLTWQATPPAKRWWLLFSGGLQRTDL